jgi:rhodanese-related sulfurtransferase
MKRRELLLTAVFVAACALGCAKKSANGGDLKEMTVDQVATRIAAHDGKTFIFDNNDKERWTKSHVPGAKWVKFNEVTAADLPADKDATLIFYCAHEL